MSNIKRLAGSARREMHLTCHSRSIDRDRGCVRIGNPSSVPEISHVPDMYMPTFRSLIRHSHAPYSRNWCTNRFVGSSRSASRPPFPGCSGQPVHSDWSPSEGPPMFEVVSEKVVYQRYLTLFSREVKFPARVSDGHQEVHEFDVVGHPKANFHFCVTFPFHPAADGKEAQVTVLQEYSQGVNSLIYSLPAGAYDPRRHSSYEACAQAELSEEALLAGGEWVELLEAGHPGVPEVKWCANRFTPFLCIAPRDDVQPGKRDTEEFIQVQRVSIPELRRLMRSGEMMLPSVTTCYWALDELRERGLL